MQDMAPDAAPNAGRDADMVGALQHALRAGRPVNFSQSDPFSATTHVPNAVDSPEGWEGQTIHAQVLRRIILDAARDRHTHARGLLIRGLRIVGTLDLYNVTLTFPLRFQKCRVEDTILLGHGRLETLEISQSWIRALLGRGARINGNLKMHYSVSHGPVVLEGAHIRGWADLWGMKIMPDGPREDALAPDPDLPEAMRRYYREENAHALMLRVAQIGNDLRLTDLRAGGPVHLEELVVGKRLFLDGADVKGRGGAGTGPRSERSYAVKGGGLRVMGNAVLSRSRFEGEVRLTGMRVEGSLRLVGTSIHSRQSRSLMLDRAHIGGDLRFGDVKPYEPREDVENAEDANAQARFEGAIRMRKIEVCGDLNLSNTVLEAAGYPNGFALRATGAVIQGEMVAIGLRVEGSFDIANARVLRKIRLYESRFAWADQSERELNAALEANHLHVASDLVIERCRFQGPVYLQDGSIQGTAYFKACHLSGLDTQGRGRDQPALAADRIFVGANLQIVGDGAESGPVRPHGNGQQGSSHYVGGINLADARIEGGLLIHGGSYEGLPEAAVQASRFGLTLEPHEAIHASGVILERGIRITGGALVRGAVNLEEALIEDEARFEQMILVEGHLHQCMRLSLCHIKGSLYLGNPDRLLDPDLQATHGDTQYCRLFPGARPVSLICLGQINLSGCVIDGFAMLRSLHVRNPLIPGPDNTSIEALSINASMVEIGKDVFVTRADPEEGRPDRADGLPYDLLADPYLVTVVGPVSFEQSEISGNLALDRIILVSREAVGASTGASGNAIGATLLAGAAKIARSVYLGRDFHSHGEVNFARAGVSQTFVSEGRHYGPRHPISTVGRQVPRALACQGMQVGVSVELRAPFRAEGMSDFTQAEIYSAFRALSAVFIAADGTALELPGAHIGRKLIIDRASRLIGDLDLTAAQIDNDLEIWRDSFNRSDGGAPPGGALAPPGAVPCLKARRMQIRGTLFLGAPSDTNAQPRPDGRHWPAQDGKGRRKAGEEPGHDTSSYILDLTDAVVGTLNDHPRAWPDAGDLILNGFTYGRIAEGAPTDSRQRLDWLHRQQRIYLTERFDPQPFDQIVRVLRQQGRPAVAEDLDVAKRTQRLRQQRNPALKLFETIARVTMRYGYQPWRAIIGLIFFAVLGAGIFNLAYEIVDPLEAGEDPFRRTRCIAPADAEFYFGRNGDGRSYPPPDYPAFHPLHFSLDLIIPIIDLRQSQYWIAASNPHCKGPWIYFHADWGQDRALEDNETALVSLPLGPLRLTAVHAANEAYWFKMYQSLQIVMGWFFATLFAALITGLVRPRQGQNDGLL
ncbi:MAG: hypothetical protein ACFB6R_16820 [Alphaproteobacteria bacterium]